VRAKPLRHDAFAAKRARLLEDGWAIRVEVRVQRYAVPRIGQQLGKPRLAIFKLRPTQVLAIDFDQVEGAKQCSAVVLAVSQQVEDR
jgi:hypothetical protein